MEGRGEVLDAEDEDFSDPAVAPAVAAPAVPMQEDSAGRSTAASDEMTGAEFSDPASMLDAADPLAAHMDALRRQLGGNFRDLTNHSDQPHLEKYVEAEDDDASIGLRAAADGEREDPRDFYARVMAHQRAMEEQAAAEAGDNTDARDETTASLLSSVPPVTPEQAAMLAAQYASIDAAAGTAPAPDDERFEAAPPKPDQQVWVKDTPDRTPVRDEAESDDEDVALLRQMSALSIERSPATGALDEAESDLAEAAYTFARGDIMQAERVADDGTVVEENELAHLSSVVDSQVAEIASTMLAADDILGSADSPLKVTERGSDIEDPVATLLSIASETATGEEKPAFEAATLEEMAKEVTSMGVPPNSMGGGAGLQDVTPPSLSTQTSTTDAVAPPSVATEAPTCTEALPDEMHIE